MKTIAITGTIGSGKSTCVKILVSLGYNVFDCDSVVQSYLNKDGILYHKVIGFFDEVITYDSGDINRKKIAQIIFNNSVIKKEYESLIYCQLKSDLIKAIDSCDDLFFAEVPLLFETEFKELFQESWLVISSEEKILHRLKTNRNLTEEEIYERINSQMSVEEKQALATHIIYNDGSEEELKEQILDLLSKEGTNETNK